MGPGHDEKAAGSVEGHCDGKEGCLTSDEVNFLVYRYLLEAGFSHAAFVFGCESDVNRVDIEGKDVPVGALVSFIQKGFQMMELEANLNENGTDVYGKYTNFTAHDILTKDLEELKDIAKALQEQEEEGVVPAIHMDEEQGERTEERACEKEPSTKQEEDEEDQRKVEDDDFPESSPVKMEVDNDAMDVPIRVGTSKHGTDAVDLPMKLRKEYDEPIICMSTSSKSNAVATISSSGELQVFSRASLEKSVTVDCAICYILSWSPSGQLLAAGGDGCKIMIFDDHGIHKYSLSASSETRHHSITSLKWNRNGTHIAAGTSQGKVVVWNAGSQSCVGVWVVSPGQNTSAVKDLSWKDDFLFAACSQNGSLALVDASVEGSMKILCDVPDNHTDEADTRRGINAVCWLQDGRLLTATNDSTLDIWDQDHGRLASLEGHTREVMFISARPCDSNILASGSKDGTIRIWDYKKQKCLASLHAEDSKITLAKWSPDGRHMVGSTEDCNIYIWEITEGDIFSCQLKARASMQSPSSNFDVIEKGKMAVIAFLNAPGLGTLDLTSIT